MKITKIRTKGGEFRSPVSTELDAVIERMRSDETKAAADLIAKGCLYSRLAMKQGMPRYYLIDVDRLPFLLFGATFGKAGLDHPKTFTGLVMLNIPCPEGLRQVQEMKRRVQQIQFTLLAFAGVSGVTLKVLVRCEYKGSDADDYLSFLKEAHESAARLYMSLVGCDLLVGEQRLVRGCFAFIAPIISASKQWGMSGTLAGMAGVALVYFVMSALIKWQGRRLLNRLFPPVVIGPVIICIGLSLSPSAVNMAKENWLLAFISLLTAILVLVLGRGLIKLVPVVCGIIVGYIVSFCMGLVDFSAVSNAPWFALPSSITHFQLPQFAWEPFLFMIPVAIAPVIEHIGDVYVVGAVANKDFVKDPGLHRTMLGDGVACLVAALLGGPPVTTYSEVTGAMQITRITNPAVIRVAAATAIVFSVIGKLSALLQSIPAAVLGGIMLMLFGSIAAVGIQNLVNNKVDLNETRNIIIVSVVLTLGIGGAIIPMGSFSLSGIGLSAVAGVILNLVLPNPNKA